MSWLYTIVFAGLMFSASDNPVNKPNSRTINTPDQTVAQYGDEIEKFEQTYPLNPNGRVSVSNVNGPITVEAWDRNEVKVEATKVADSREALADVNIKVNARPEYLSIEADYDEWKNDRDKGWKENRKLEVQFRLMVPRTAILREIETVNGSVTVGNFTNFTKVSAVNGNVTAMNLRGTADLSTVNGEVLAEFDRLEPGSKVTLGTVNGKANIVIPSDSSATIKADTLNGGISNNLGLPVRKGEYVGRDLYGRIGSGDVQIRLNSVNGALSINRRNDGKSPSPATNLLQQKKTDEEWDDDSDKERSAADLAKIKREVARAVRQSKQQTASAVAEAQRSAAAFPPELGKIKAIDVEQLKVEVDAAKYAEQVRIGAEKQAEVFARMRNANWPMGTPIIQKKRNSFSVKGTPKVTINAKGCGVRVRGWDKPEVQYVVTELSGRRDRQPPEINENVSDSQVKIVVVNPNTTAPGSNFTGEVERIRIDVFVPRKSNLSIVTDGEIRLDGVSGEIDLEGGSGSINVRDTDGKMTVATEEGMVRIIGFKGDLSAGSNEGDMFLEGDFLGLKATASTGDVVITLSERSSFSLHSNSEPVVEGIELKRSGSNEWKLGTGTSKYDLDLGDGKLVVRGFNQLNTY